MRRTCGPASASRTGLALIAWTSRGVRARNTRGVPNDDLRRRVVRNGHVARRRIHDLTRGVLRPSSRNCMRPGGTSNVALTGRRLPGAPAAPPRRALLGNTSAEERPAVGRERRQRHVRDALVAGASLARHGRNRLPRERDLRLAVLAAAVPIQNRAGRPRGGVDERRERGASPPAGASTRGAFARADILGGVGPVAFARPHVDALARHIDVDLVELARRSAPAPSCSRSGSSRWRRG